MQNGSICKFSNRFTQLGTLSLETQTVTQINANWTLKFMEVNVLCCILTLYRLHYKE